MKKEALNSKLEVFICNHKRDNQDDCFHKGGKELTDNLKKWSREKFGSEVKIFRSGCIGKCEEGIAALCYPSKEFLVDLTRMDEEEMKKYIEEQNQKFMQES